VKTAKCAVTPSLRWSYLRVEFIGSPMVRCYSTGETYEQSEIRWTLKSKLPNDMGFDVENTRGDDMMQDFLPNAHQLGEEIEA
jgi:hypothetical protein